MSSCGKKKNTETVAQYRKRCGGRPLGMIQKVSEEHTCHDCGQPIDINEAGFKFVIRNKKKIKKLICPPGTKSKGRKKCVRMASKERIKRAKGLKVTRRKAKGKLAKTLRKRAKSMKKRKGMGLSESLKLEELVGKPITEAQFDEAAGEKDACYRKVKARYDVWPSAYASGALVKCRKVGAKNWGNKSKKEGVNEVSVGVNVHYFYKKANKNKNKFFKMLSDFRKKHSDTVWIKMLNYALEDFNENPKKYKTIDDKQNILFKNLQNNKKVKEGLGDRMSKKLKKHKGVNLKNKKSKLKLKLKGRGVYQKYDGLDDGINFESITENGMTTNHIYYEEDGKGYGYTLEFVNDLNEAEYQGRKVKLGKIMQGDAKKFKVYVKNPKGNVVKVNFGQGGKAKGGTMKIRKSNPKARANFRARHNCDNPGPRHKARYWACRTW